MNHTVALINRPIKHSFKINPLHSKESVCLLGHFPAMETFIVVVFGYECDEIKTGIKAGWFLEIELYIQINLTIALIF